MASDAEINTLLGPNRLLVPFLACGDLSGWDSDRTYELELPNFSGEAERGRYEYRPVVQPPTEPAYKVRFYGTLSSFLYYRKIF